MIEFEFNKKESPVEKYLRDEIKKIGGKAYKFVSPGNNGVPDRLILLPGLGTIFVETKALGKKSRPDQVNRQKEMAKLGAKVYKDVDTKEKADVLVKALKGRFKCLTDDEWSVLSGMSVMPE